MFLWLLGLAPTTQAQIFYHNSPTPKLGFSCPKVEMLDKLLGFGDLFLGELHGTAQTPALIQCLVARAVESVGEKIIVSLEMPSSAREPLSDFWQAEKQEDGRSSKAMFELVKYLVDKENQALINIHFQYHTRFFDEPSEISIFHKNSAQKIGEQLYELSEQGLVIALAGNVHSMKFLPEGYDPSGKLKTEGMFVGRQFTHINLMSATGGEFWGCAPDCGVQKHSSFSDAESLTGTLTEGESTGHDYIYYLDIDGFTASGPAGLIDPNTESVPTEE